MSVQPSIRVPREFDFVDLHYLILAFNVLLRVKTECQVLKFNRNIVGKIEFLDTH